MSFFNAYFDRKIFCVNLARRTDRWSHAQGLFKQFDIAAQRFEACVVNDEQGRPHGNSGCVASHRALLEMQIANEWPVMCVLEDDVDIIYIDFHERFGRFIAELPTDWGLIYLGGGYAEPPLARVSKHVIRAGGMMTTSSYGITLAQARKMAPHLSGVGPIDSLFQGFNRGAPTYVMSPRAIVQMPSYSDLTERECNNAQSMLDRALEGDLR